MFYSMCVCIFVGKHVCVSEKETKRGYIEKSIWDIWSSYGFKNRVFDTSLSCTFNVQIKGICYSMPSFRE